MLPMRSSMRVLFFIVLASQALMMAVPALLHHDVAIAQDSGGTGGGGGGGGQGGGQGGGGQGGGGNQGDLNLDINVKDTGTTVWYAQWWVWAIGVGVFLIVVIALTNRGGRSA